MAAPYPAATIAGASPTCHATETTPTVGGARSLLFAEGFIERIADPPYGADWVTFVPARQHLAHAPDVNIDGAIVAFERLPPNAIEELFASKHPARPFEQTFEQNEFRRRETEIAQAPARSSGLEVEFQIAPDKQLIGEIRPAASK